MILKGWLSLIVLGSDKYLQFLEHYANVLDACIEMISVQDFVAGPVVKN